MTRNGRRYETPTKNGRGAGRTRNGQIRPLHYSPPKPVIRIGYMDSSTGWSIASGVSTLATASITTPQGNSESLIKMTGSAAGTNSFWDYTFPVATAPGTKYTSLVIDLYTTQPTTSATAGTAADGATYSITLAVSAFGGANNIACTLQVGYGWQRIELCSADFSTINGTASWTGSTFIGIRFKINGTTGHTQSVWIREISWL